jgi:amidase
MNVDLPPAEFITREERTQQFMVLYNVTGQPAISLPLGMHSNGLPIGVQLGARPGEDHLLIELGAALEQAMPWRDRKPPSTSLKASSSRPTLASEVRGTISMDLN